MNFSKEQQASLDMCDAHIAESDRHISDQKGRIERLQARGLDASAYQDFLNTLIECATQHRADKAALIDSYEAELSL